MPSPRVTGLPDRAAVLAATPLGRDRAIDVARLGSLLVVMFGHCALLLAAFTDNGLWVRNTLGAQPSLQPITWVLQVMPLFFLAGAASAAYGVKPETSWGGWLLTRAQRLARPVFWYLGFWSIILVAVQHFAGDSSAARLGQESVALLWFIGVYPLVLAFVPTLVRVRSGAALAGVALALLVAAGGFDAARKHTGSIGWGVPNFLIVWLIPAVIGVAYARKLIRRPFAAAIGALAFGAAVLAVVGPYDVPLVVTGRETFPNSTPPTLLLGLHCVWVSALFVLTAPAIGRWARRPKVWYPVAVGNAGAMTLYLWHIPVIAVAATALHYLGSDASDPGQNWFWGSIALRAVVFAALMFATFLLLSPLEHRRLPWWDDRVTARGIRGAAVGTLVCAGSIGALLMAKEGLGSVAGWCALLLFVAALLLARALATPAAVPLATVPPAGLEPPRSGH